MRHVRRMAAVAGSLILLATLAASGVETAGARAAVLEPVGTFEQPIFVTSDPGDPDRLLVVEREGTVQLVEEGAAGLFADISHLVSCCAGERGLLSIAPAPDFAASGRFYAAYTGTEAAGGAHGDLHVDAFRHDEAGALLREPILTIGHDEHANHNGGQLQLGPDGYLYISTGDGGGGGDPLESGQDLDTLLGKLLRIEPRPGDDPPYAIPPGNPFAGGAGRDEIWAYGLRNPWRFSFDRAGGDLVIADVGQNAREEIDHEPSPAPGEVGGAGANYGWNCREGSIAYSGAPPECEEAGPFTDPVFDYPHEDPEDGSAHGCSITGGYVVRDPGLEELRGRYVYGDFCVGQIRSIDLSAPDPAATDRAEPELSVPEFSLFSFGEDACGRIYAVRGDGLVQRLEGDEPTDCSPEPEPQPEPGPAPEGAPPPRDGGAPGPRTPITLRLRAARLWVPAGRRVLIAARLAPCPPDADLRLQLRRDGRPLATGRLDPRCLARFAPPIRRRSTFRAVLPLPGARGLLASRSLVVHPYRGRHRAGLFLNRPAG